MGNKYTLNHGYFSTHGVIVRLIGKNKTVLDIGCNEGYLGEASDQSNTLYGIDSSVGAIKLAKKKYKDAVVYDINSLHIIPWKEVGFDVLVFADVLEHLIDPQKVLTFFVRKYLKKKGKVIISLPNIANWKIRLKLLFGTFTYTETGILDKSHLHFYTYSSAKELVKTSGLRYTRELAGSTLFGPFISLFPFLKSFLATNIILESVIQI